MAFPQDATPGKGYLEIDGTYTDITSYIRGEHRIEIGRGRRDIQGDMPPTFCNFTLNNGGEDPEDRGRFTDDNPMSPYFGLLPMFTKFYWIVPGAADGYLYLPGFDGGDYSYTSDKAALDITGDIDIRVEISPSTWNMPVEAGLAVLAMKANNVNPDFSWAFCLDVRSRMYFAWDDAGVSASGFGHRSAAIPVQERMALRVTLDVNNGLGGYTVSFYYADDLDSSWTLLTNTVTTSATTSIFSSNSALSVGASGVGTGLFSGGKTFSGKIYGFELRNGIAGTLVADADFKSQAVGVTSFADGLGNTWGIISDAYVTSDAVRFWGEIESFPQEWDATGKDMLSRIHASDLLQRLGTSQTQVRSPIYLNRIQVDPTGYWTFEDGAEATRAGAVSRSTASAIATLITFKAADDLPGSDGVAQFAEGGAFARGFARSSTTTGTASFLGFFKFGTSPASTVQVFSTVVVGSSTVNWWRVETDGASFTIRAFAADGTSLLSNAITLGTDVVITDWISLRLELTTSGANIAWALAWHQVGQHVFWGSSGTIAGSVGRFASFTISGSAANTDMYFAHIVLDTDTTDFTSSDFASAARGYIGETFSERFRRICTAKGITPDLDGWEMDTSALGRQPIDTELNILKDGARVDGGILLGSRRQPNAITYITRGRIQQQSSAVTLEHDGSSHLAATPKPVFDSVGVANDVTVTRPGGGFSRRVVTDGKLGTDNIGSVPGGGDYNVETDEATDVVAGWLANLGTAEDKRFPEIEVQLNRSQTVLGSAIGQEIMAVDAGRYLVIDNMPAGQRPDPAEQLIQGYLETHSNKLWKIVFNGTPYAPWRAGIIEGVLEPPRFVATDTTVNDATSTATSLTFVTATGSARWVLASDLASTPFPFDVMIAGERMTITAITGATNTQTVTVTRSVNGVVKAISGSPQVQLYRVFTFGRAS